MHAKGLKYTLEEEEFIKRNTDMTYLEIAQALGRPHMGLMKKARKIGIKRGHSEWLIKRWKEQKAEDNIKPCPLCGSKDIVHKTDDGVLICCENCNLLCGKDLETWNKRNG